MRYVPGKARSHHLEMMLSKEELEEEQRSVKPANVDATFSQIEGLLVYLGSILTVLKVVFYLSLPSAVNPVNPLYAVVTCFCVSSGFCLEVYCHV